MLLTSPRNSVSAHVNLFTLLHCKTLITAGPGLPVVGEIVASCSARLLEAPSLTSLLEERYQKFPYTKTYEEGMKDPLAVLHTSGSTGCHCKPKPIAVLIFITGLPKPITIPLSFANVFAAMTQLDPPAGLERQSKFLHGNRLFCTLPLFHVSYLSL